MFCVQIYSTYLTHGSIIWHLFGNRLYHVCCMYKFSNTCVQSYIDMFIRKLFDIDWFINIIKRDILFPLTGRAQGGNHNVFWVQLVRTDCVRTNIVRALADLVATKIWHYSSFYLLSSFHLLFFQKGLAYDFEFFMFLK